MNKSIDKVTQKSVSQVVLEFVSTDKPVTGNRLCQSVGSVFDITINPVEMRIIIKNLRAKGNIIIGTTRGYFVAKTKSQFDTYIESREKELSSELTVLDLMRTSRAYKRLA